MGWDIVFRARFPTPEAPSQRFGRIYEAVRCRPSFLSLKSFGVFSDAALIRPLARLDEERADGGLVTQEGVKELLRQHAANDEVAIAGTWQLGGERDGVATLDRIRICVWGPKLRDQRVIPADVTWELGDSRRYTAEGKDNYPNSAQVMADLAVLVEVGSESIWGVDSSLTISPRHLFAIFHRDPNAFHDDGVDPPYPDLPIDNEMIDIVLASAKYASDKRTVQTDAGPIIYHEDLGNGGDLRIFYAGLGGVLQADAEGVD